MNFPKTQMQTYQPYPQQNLNISNLNITGNNSSRVLNPKIGASTPMPVQFYQGQYYQPYTMVQNQQLVEQKKDYIKQAAVQSPFVAQRQQQSQLQYQNIPSPEIQKKSKQHSNTKLTKKMNFLISEVDRLTITVDNLLKENEEWREKYQHVKNLLSQFNKQQQQNTSSIKKDQSIEKSHSKENASQIIENQEEFQALKANNKELKQQLTLAEQNLEETKKHSIANNEKLLEAIEIYQSDALAWKQKTEALEELIEEIQEENKQKQGKVKAQDKNYLKEMQSQLDQSEQDKKELELKVQKLKQLLNEVETQKTEQEKDLNQKIISLTQTNSKLQQKQLLSAKSGSVKIDISTELSCKDKIQKLSEENETLLTNHQQQIEKNKILEQEIKQLHKYQTLQSIEKEQTYSPASRMQYVSQDPTPHNLIQNKSNVQQENKDDYLVRQLRKFQEIQQSNQLEKKGQKKELDKKTTKKTTKR